MMPSQPMLFSPSFHLLAFAGSALDASAGDVKVNAVTDPLFMTNNNNFRMPNNYKIQFAYAGGVGLLRARINAPHYRVPGFPQIAQVNAVLPVPANAALLDARRYPLELYNNEEVSIEGTNGAANTIVSFLGVTQGDLNPEQPSGDIRWVRFTATPSSLALAWSAPGAITFQDQLQSGIYSVWGMIVSGTTLLAARLVFNNQYHRPGVIGMAAADTRVHSIFDMGLGRWGNFENSNPPQLEVFDSAAAVASFVGLLAIKLESPQ